MIPLNTARDCARDKLYPGAIVPIKFCSKYYEAEILKM